LRVPAISANTVRRSWGVEVGHPIPAEIGIRTLSTSRV
jgi:hypothetical protein